jgi:hypothetical protein
MIQRVSRSALPPALTPAPVSRGPSAGFAVDRTPATPVPRGQDPPGDGMVRSVGRLVTDLEQERREIDRLIRQAARGRSFSPAELLLLQSKVYSFGQQMEVVSRMVDKTVSAVKTTLNTQI